MVEPMQENVSQGSQDAWDDYDFTDDAPGLNRFISMGEGQLMRSYSWKMIRA